MATALLCGGETMEAVKRASAHAAARTHEELRRGVASLAGIATIAPLIGLFGTVLGIAGSLRSYNSSASTILADITRRLSESLAPTILGLAVAIVSFWFYRYLNSQMEAFDREMENTSVDLINRLIVHLGRLAQPAVRVSLPPAVERAPSAVEAPRLAIDERTYRNRLLELAWPRLKSESDVRSVLHFGMWISLAYGFVGWLTCLADRRPAAGIVICLFFAIAARRVRAGSLAAILGVFAFLAFAALLCIISSGWTLAAVYLLTAPLLLVSSVSAARFPIAKPAFSISSVLLGLLGMAASTTVLFGTVLTLYPIGMDWIVSLRAPWMGPVHRGDLVAFWNGNVEGAERAVGLPGDRIRVVSGKLIRNGKEVVQSCCQQPFTEYLGNFPLPKDVVFDGDLQFEYLNAYGDRLLNKTEFIVPDESYFLLNDNRNELLDSRVFGPVWTSHIVGRPLLAYRAWRVPILLQ